MIAELLMATVGGVVIGFTSGVIAKHFMDNKYFKAYEEFSIKSVKSATKKACRKMAKHDLAIIKSLYARIDALEKENAYLRHPDFFEVPTKIKADNIIKFPGESL